MHRLPCERKHYLQHTKQRGLQRYWTIRENIRPSMFCCSTPNRKAPLILSALDSRPSAATQESMALTDLQDTNACFLRKLFTLYYY